MPTTPTQQPAEWSRVSLKECADILFVNKNSTNGGLNTKRQALANDVVITINHFNGSVDLEVDFLQEDTEYENTNAVIVRSKSPEVNPLWLYYTIGQDGFSKAISTSHESMFFTSFSLAKTIERFVVAVPSTPIQNEILNMLEMSSGWLKKRAANLQRQSDLMVDMEKAITSELLLGNRQPSDVAQWLRSVVEPMSTPQEDIEPAAVVKKSPSVMK